MKWAPEAEKAIKKVPFFVRKRVRARVEKEADAEGKPVVTLAEVKATQRRYLNNMESEMRGYQLDACFGPSGCPNRAIENDGLVPRIQALLEAANLLGFLKQTVSGKLRFHHELRIAVADCPNACSQPQIKDIGIIGACRPRITPNECTRCEACLDACPEEAVILDETAPGLAIEDARCIACGKCVAVCPTGTLAAGQTGYRVQLGGKLGRHPRLATELPDIYDEDTVLRIIQDCIDWYKARSRNGQRFANLLKSEDIEVYSRELQFPLR
ncbi:MAG: 4Fe-4S binding protein [Desulfosarcina sp.]|nr:4Fe-4S binding protein [Desulfobacterales bacterium]